MSKVMSKAELMAEGKLKTEIVPMGNDKHVIITEISALDYNEVLKASEGKADDKGVCEIDMRKFNPLLLAYCIVDTNKKRIFNDADAPSLANVGQGFSMKLMPTVKKLNGLQGDGGNDSEATEDASHIGE